MIALSSLLIYCGKFVCLTLFPVVLNRDFSNEIGGRKFKCQFYIQRCSTKIKKLPIKKEISVSNPCRYQFGSYKTKINVINFELSFGLSSSKLRISPAIISVVSA